MQRACEELGIEIIFANSPQSKGRVERAFDTFLDGVVPELQMHHIDDIQSANKYLQNQFIPMYWQKKIAVQAKNPRSAFKVVPKHINLDTVCVHKEYRKVRRDHTFSYNNKMYLIDSPIRYSIVNQKLEICCQFDGAFSAYFCHRKLHITELEEPPRASEYGMEVQRKLEIRCGRAGQNIRECLEGCSRQSIYTYQNIFEEEGVIGLKRINKPLKRSKNSIPQETEDKIMEVTLDNSYYT